MKLRKDKAVAGPSTLTVVSGGEPLAPPTPPGASALPGQVIDIPSSLSKAFRVTAGATAAMMGVVMRRAIIAELREA